MVGKVVGVNLMIGSIEFPAYKGLVEAGCPHV